MAHPGLKHVLVPLGRIRLCLGVKGHCSRLAATTDSNQKKREEVVERKWGARVSESNKYTHTCMTDTYTDSQTDTLLPCKPRAKTEKKKQPKNQKTFHTPINQSKQTNPKPTAQTHKKKRGAQGNDDVKGALVEKLLRLGVGGGPEEFLNILPLHGSLDKLLRLRHRVLTLRR